ncbi:MAG TPA: extracellular solute-binding protein, partial [Polyangiaceae bacterium]
VRQDDYFGGVWETNRFEGSLYGVPWYVDTRLLFYRRDLLASAGFDEPPRTWAQWLEMLGAIQERAAADQAALFLPLNEPEPLVAFALQEADPLLRDGNRYGNFRSPGFRRALSFYVELFARGLAPKQGSGQIANLWDEFARGSFVFYVSGPWQIGELKRRLPPELDGSWMTAGLPGRTGPGTSLAGGSSLVVFAESKRKALAWKLIEYLSEPAVQQRFYELTGDLPPRRESWAAPALTDDVRVRAFREQLERVEPTPKVPEWERIAGQLARVSERAARSLTSVEAAATELDERTDRILEKRRWVLEHRQAP